MKVANITGGSRGIGAAVAKFNRFRTCVTLVRLTPKCRASAARLSNLPLSSNA
jgi:NAD(P)-dependent dehydrogenase (short-subunit alcohol dehydrogenase family)